MFFSSSCHVSLLVLAATSQLVLGDSSSQALGRRAGLEPKYSGKWVELKDNRFQGIYKSDHLIPSESMARVCTLAAKSMKEIYKGLTTNRPNAPMAMTAYQNTVGDFVFASSGSGEHGEELAASIAPGGLSRGHRHNIQLEDTKSHQSLRLRRTRLRKAPRPSKRRRPLAQG